MKIDRRRFFKRVWLLPIAFKKKAGAAVMSEKEELREILFNRPDLFHFKARDGHFAHVWLNGKECSEGCTEYVGHPLPGKKVRGAVQMITKNKKGEPVMRTGSIVTQWKVGWVYWKSIKSA